MSKSLEVLADIGGKVQEAALQAGYGPTIRADAVKKLVDSRRQLPGALAADRRRDAQAVDQELRRDPRRGRGRQEAHRPAGRRRQGAAAPMLSDATRVARLTRRAPRAAEGARRPDARHGRGGHAAPQRDLVARELTTRTARSGAHRAPAPDLPRARASTSPTAILDEGVKALKESRFVYTPPPPGLRRDAGELWVTAARIGKVAGAAVGLLAAAWLGYSLVGGASRPAAQERARIELTQIIPTSLDQVRSDILADAKADEARQKADPLYADRRPAAEGGRRARPRRARLAPLEALRTDVRSTYQLLVVSRPGERSGRVSAIPDGTRGARTTTSSSSRWPRTARCSPFP